MQLDLDLDGRAVVVGMTPEIVADGLVAQQILLLKTMRNKRVQYSKHK